MLDNTKGPQASTDTREAPPAHTYNTRLTNKDVIQLAFTLHDAGFRKGPNDTAVWPEMFDTYEAVADFLGQTVSGITVAQTRKLILETFGAKVAPVAIEGEHMNVLKARITSLEKRVEAAEHRIDELRSAHGRRLRIQQGLIQNLYKELGLPLPTCEQLGIPKELGAKE